MQCHFVDAVCSLVCFVAALHGRFINRYWGGGGLALTTVFLAVLSWHTKRYIAQLEKIGNNYIISTFRLFTKRNGYTQQTVVAQQVGNGGITAQEMGKGVYFPLKVTDQKFYYVIDKKGDFYDTYEVSKILGYDIISLNKYRKV